MVLNANFTEMDLIANELNNDVKMRAEFLSAPVEERGMAVRDVTIWAHKKIAKGEGNIPIAVTKRGYIVVGFSDPKVREGKDSHPIVSNKEAYEGMFHSSMADRSYCVEIARSIPYEVLCKYVNGLQTELSNDIENFIVKTFNSSMNNINKSFKRERYNLLLSLKEYKEYPKTLDSDSIAGMNLTVVSEMMTRMIISEEDVKGNKKYLKRSQLEANPTISLAIKDLIYSMAKTQSDRLREPEEEEEE